MLWSFSTEKSASEPWQTLQFSIFSPVDGSVYVMSAACPKESSMSWHDRHTRADGAFHATLRQLPPTQAWPMPHGAVALQVAAESAWHLVQLRTSCGRRISLKSSSELRKPTMLSLPGLTRLLRSKKPSRTRA